MASTLARGERRPLLDEFFGIDLRSLAVSRIAIASALLYDVLDRSTDLRALYTNHGVLPTDTLLALWGRASLLSPFYHVSDYPTAVAALFALQCCAAIAMALGWRTQWAGWLCWYLLVSIQVRNPLAAQEGCDRFLPQVLFLALLLPIGARWSLDARRRVTPMLAKRVLSVASAAAIVQLCLLYWVTGFMKRGDTWMDGTAVYYALHLDFWAVPFGVWLRDHTTATHLMTWGTVWLERLGPFFAFVPVWTGPVRVALIATFIGFHLSLASALNVGPFPLYSLIAWPVLLPSWFWDEALPRLRGIRAPNPEKDRTPPAAALRSSLPVQVLAAGLLVLMVIHAIEALRIIPDFRSNPVNVVARQVGQIVRFSQNWRMFAPNPPDRDIWPVLQGETVGGRFVDPLTGEVPMVEKPELLSSSYPSFRWRLYYAILIQFSKDERMGPPLLQALSEHFCRDWNERHDGQDALTRIGIEYWIEFTDEPVPIQRLTAHEHSC